MSNLFKHLGFIDKGIQRLAGWWTILPALAAALAVAVAFMTWVTRSITLLEQYGWGLPVLVAIGIVLLIVVVLSFGAIAWRKYHPLPPSASLATEIPARSSETIAWESDLSSKVDGLKRELQLFTEGRAKDIELLKLRLPALERQISEVAARFDQHSAEIVHLNERVIAQHKVGEAVRGQIATLLSRAANHERRFGYLIDAIQAHDVETQIKEADVLIVPLGQKLLAGTGYSDPEAWLADYQSWHDALATIDQTILRQKVEGFTPYLDVRARDLQKCSEAPPTESLRADGNVIVAYKTIFLAQRRYVQGREQVFRYFAVKAALPG